jgi:hypothetical protein
MQRACPVPTAPRRLAMRSTLRPFLPETQTCLANSMPAGARRSSSAVSATARGAVVSRETRDLIELREGFPKPMEGKSKFLGRKIKARGSGIQASSFHGSRLFKDLRGNPTCEPLLLFGSGAPPSASSVLSSPRRRATLPRQRPCHKRSSRPLRTARPAIHARLAFSRPRGLFGNQHTS